MSAATGGFDAVVQLEQTALQRVFTAMHRAGPSEHRAVHTSGDRLIELVLNTPTVTLDPSAPAGEVRARARSRVLYHERSIANPAEVGVNAACDLTLRATVRVPGGDPVPVDVDTVLLEDWTATGAQDVTVFAPAPADAAVRAQLLDFAHAHRGVFDLDFLAGSGVAEIGTNVIGRPQSTPLVAVGVNFSVGAGGASNALTIPLCQSDWAFAISAEYFVEAVTGRLAADVGGLPPPYGPAPVLLSDDGAAQVFLDAFTVLVAPGVIVLSGALRRETGGLFGTTSATWSATVTVSVNAAGSLQVAVSQPQVQLHEWWAVIGNWVSGGQIATAVSAAVADQLAGGINGAGLSGLLASSVGRLATAGRTLNAPLDVHANNVEVRPDAIVVHGAVVLQGAPPAPVASLVAMQSDVASDLVFHAGASWCPGGEIESIRWDFGDGNSQTNAGTGVTFVAAHSYVPGQYLAQVTVTDPQGRSASASVAVQPGSLVVDLVGSGGGVWEFCKSAPALRFKVHSSGFPVRGATVTVVGNGWEEIAVTDAAGLAALTLNAISVEHFGLAVAKPDRFHLGAVRVTAAKPGWMPRQGDLWMVDCDEMFAVRLAAEQRRQEILDRLAGYAALKDLIKRIGKGRPPFGEFVDPLGPPEPKTVFEDELGAAIGVLSDLEDLVRDGSRMLPVATLFGIGPDDPEGLARVEERLDELWGRVEDAAREHDGRFGFPSGDWP